MKNVLIALVSIVSVSLHAQPVERPKLVVGITIDQMRWDYLYRYYDRYTSEGGFKRLLHGGFSCENTSIPYAPSVTACGHTCIYTGSVPAINGITGNIWIDRLTNKSIYCSEDKTVKTVGASNESGLMSPRNMLTTTICDELRLATNFKSKVVGIALKDRGSILPAGHSANAAYWYDGLTGNWITSSYYMPQLPAWVSSFNDKKLVDKYYSQNWNTLYPINTYTQSTEDVKPYESKGLGNQLPYDLNKFSGKNYGVISGTPHGNSLTEEFAKAAITNEKLGTNGTTDFLAVSFSSTDYVGHAYGPNSVEEEDTYLRLDKDLGDFLNFLDTKIGKSQYLLFLSADHGAAQVPGFLKENKIPAGNFDLAIVDSLNTLLKQRFGKDKIIAAILNYQVYLNTSIIEADNLNERDIKTWIIQNIIKLESVARAFDIKEIKQTTLNSKVQDMLVNGYYPKRCGDIQLILQPQWIEGFIGSGTTHGLWNPYDTHIPLLWYGWGIRQGKSNKENYMTDIAPTLGALLHIQMPSGSVGKVIEEIMK